MTMAINTKNKNHKLRVSITKYDIKVLSWNIQSPSSVEGNKFENKSFQEIINSHALTINGCISYVHKCA